MLSNESGCVREQEVTQIDTFKFFENKLPVEKASDCWIAESLFSAAACSMQSMKWESCMPLSSWPDGSPEVVEEDQKPGKFFLHMECKQMLLR